MVRYRTTWYYLCIYFLFAATALRGIVDFFSNEWPQRWPVAVLLSLVGTLIFFEPWVTKRGAIKTALYLGCQMLFTFSLALQSPFLDYFLLLFVILSAQAMFLLQPRRGLYWIGAFTTVTAVALFYGQGWPAGVPFLLMYSAAYLFVGSYALVTIQAETGRQESQRLLAELQAAHHQLQQYANQVKTLTVIEERQRLARDLHDSVTHTLFSINLTAEAARMLYSQDPARLEKPLTQLQTLAQSALAELRSLIFELRPLTETYATLSTALRRHIVAVAEQHDLTVDLQIEDEPELADSQAEQLLRVIQEALHNVVKHAQTKQAAIVLKQINRATAPHLQVVIRDHGVGFAPEALDSSGIHFGLTTMRERVASLDGSFELQSSPGVGTEITVTIPLQAVQYQKEQPNE